MRIGCWRWVHDYESGEGTWYWEGAKHEPKTAARQPRERLAEAISQEKSLKTCAKHPRTVHYDGPRCPACQAEREFKNLTRGMLFSNRTKPVELHLKCGHTASNYRIRGGPENPPWESYCAKCNGD